MKLKRFATLTASCIAVASMLFTGTSLAARNKSHMTQDSFSPQQKKEIQNIVHDYLVNNPEVLLQASMALRKKMEAKQQTDAMKAIETNKAMLFNNKQNPSIGNPDGNVKMVEFFDYQCPHCKVMSKTIDNLVKKNSNLQVIFKEWPIFGGSSLEASKAAIAANMQGKYFALHNELLSADNPLTKDKIFQFAKKVGLNITKLKHDMDKPAVMAQIKANFALARKLNLAGTPAFVLTNKAENKFQFIPGQTSQENLQKLITQLEK